VYRGQRIRSNLVEKFKLTLGVNEAYVEKAVEAIIRGARTGQVGDGKIFVTPLEECIRIRTGERGGSAI
jgi:nitrogen regulatory protein P-II 1